MISSVEWVKLYITNYLRWVGIVTRNSLMTQNKLEACSIMELAIILGKVHAKVVVSEGCFMSQCKTDNMSHIFTPQRLVIKGSKG